MARFVRLDCDLSNQPCLTFLTRRGRYVAIQPIDAIDGGDAAAISELYLLDAEGNRIAREGWTVAYADSEDTAGNHTADKAFDLQESTYWSATGTFPHLMVIDLGQEHELSGIQYLPRMETGAPGAIGHFKIYVK